MTEALVHFQTMATHSVGLPHRWPWYVQLGTVGGYVTNARFSEQQEVQGSPDPMTHLRANSKKCN